MFKAFLLSLVSVFTPHPTPVPVIFPTPTPQQVQLVAPSASLSAKLLASASYMRWDLSSFTPATPPADLYQGDELTGNIQIQISDVATVSGQSDLVLSSLVPDRVLFTQKSGRLSFETSNVISVRFLSNLAEISTGSAQINLSSYYPTLRLTSGTAKFAQVGNDGLPHLYFLTSGQLAYFTPWGVYVY